MDTIMSDKVRCPTCRALQEWSDHCRRCRSDLRLLHAVCSTHRQHLRRCLLELDAGHPEIALGHALRCYDLHPGPESLRLLSLCAMTREEWDTALELAQAADRSIGSNRSASMNRNPVPLMS